MNKMKKGFTLVELVIIIAVIAVLAAVLIPTFAGIIERANNSANLQRATHVRDEFVSANFDSVSEMENYIIEVDKKFYVVNSNGQLDNLDVANLEGIETGYSYNIEESQTFGDIVVYEPQDYIPQEESSDDEIQNQNEQNQNENNLPPQVNETQESEPDNTPYEGPVDFLFTLNETNQTATLTGYTGRSKDLVIPERVILISSEIEYLEFDNFNEFEYFLHDCYDYYYYNDEFYDEMEIRTYSPSLPAKICIVDTNGNENVIHNGKLGDFESYDLEYELNLLDYVDLDADFTMEEIIRAISDSSYYLEDLYYDVQDFSTLTIENLVQLIDDHMYYPGEFSDYIQYKYYGQTLTMNKLVDALIEEGYVYREELPYYLGLRAEDVLSDCEFTIEITRKQFNQVQEGGYIVTAIGEDTFEDSSIETVILPSTLKVIGEDAFSGSDLIRIEIPEGVTTISSDAFYACYELEFASIPSTVTSMGSYVFGACQVMKNVTLANGLTMIGSNAFWKCYRLVDIVIPASMTTIGKEAFKECYHLAEIYNLSSHLSLSIGSTNNGYLAYYAKVIHTSLSEESNIEIINDIIYYTDANGKVCLCGEDRSLTEIIIADGTISISAYAFYDFGNATTGSMTNSVRIIGERAFYNCYNMTTLYVSKNIQSTGSQAYGLCSKLTRYTNP